MDQANLTQLQQIANQAKTDAGFAARKEEQRAQIDAFNKEFERVKKEIIWPVLVDVGNELNKLGHDYHVDDEEQSVDATAHENPSSLQFNLFPAGIDRAYYKPDSTPYIKFYANAYAKKVGIQVSTMMPGQGGSVGVHGEYDLSQITKEFVEKEVIRVLKDSMVLGK